MNVEKNTTGLEIQPFMVISIARKLNMTSTSFPLMEAEANPQTQADIVPPVFGN